METVDENLELNQPQSGQKRRREGSEEETKRPKQKREQHIKKELWPEKLQRFVEATDKAIAGLKAGQQKLKVTIVVLPFESCRVVTNILVAMFEGGDAINDCSATLYRNTAATLMTILSDERTQQKVSGQMLTTVIDRLGKMVNHADSSAKPPVALSDSVLKEILDKLKQFVEEHDGDIPKRMQKFIQNQKRDLAGNNFESSLNILVNNIYHDAKQCLINQDIGLAPRTEEHWAIFTEMISGEANAFGVLPSPEYSEYLTDPSEMNCGVMLYTVNCEVTYAATFYPLELEDNNSALNR
ncbi:hypothetical protein BBO99_00000126 [Phytophthora kernoviae]|uniref:Uncharacterized protein n=2 Tax=Phytophthora kernoviae TaxID=325452 RepID=A0A3R7JZL3_9STRA|nr:hypothetical protein G195_004085 [Phytophthora kernoviae 00238/432]KAG2526293.1 hypothetical protein JM18_004443 [Phytophthora kernoviae]RLM96786.1 hypothetical protein BBI17_000228 [Phytophthora kernoviae]RLN85874.1 hypothetical protein BBO99_00000126 [Phytophthora kernoviae]